jgi:hypothetical protein
MTIAFRSFASLTLIGLGLSGANDISAEVPLPSHAIHVAKSTELDGQQVEMEGWVRFHGEILLFDSRSAMKIGLVYPYCISASGSPSVLFRGKALDKQHVRVSGTLRRYPQGTDDPATISTSTTINGMWFKNWCFGPYVLEIDDLTLLRRK